MIFSATAKSATVIITALLTAITGIQVMVLFATQQKTTSNTKYIV
jgi:hypothetical protein